MAVRKVVAGATSMGSLDALLSKDFEVDQSEVRLGLHAREIRERVPELCTCATSLLCWGNLEAGRVLAVICITKNGH